MDSVSKSYVLTQAEDNIKLMADNPVGLLLLVERFSGTEELVIEDDPSDPTGRTAFIRAAGSEKIWVLRETEEVEDEWNQ